jgi:hypothetical protein
MGALSNGSNGASHMSHMHTEPRLRRMLLVMRHGIGAKYVSSYDYLRFAVNEL